MELDNELPEGRYFCPKCDRETQYEYVGFPSILNEICEDEELIRLAEKARYHLMCSICIEEAN